MQTFDVDEALALLEPGDHELIGAVRPLDAVTTTAMLRPLLIRSN